MPEPNNNTNPITNNRSNLQKGLSILEEEDDDELIEEADDIEEIFEDDDIEEINEVNEDEEEESSIASLKKDTTKVIGK